MLRVVKSHRKNHLNDVLAAMCLIFNSDYQITSVKNVKQPWFGWGDNVTHIHYHRPQTGKSDFRKNYEQEESSASTTAPTGRTRYVKRMPQTDT